MEITNILLNDLGADPKVYSAEEKLLIGEYAEKIKAGELSSLLASCALPEERLAFLKETYGKNREDLTKNMKKIADLSEKIVGVFNKKTSIFTSVLSDEEKLNLLTEGVAVLSGINELKNEALFTVGRILSGMTELYELQAVYNETLARLGMINIAARAAETEGAAYDEDDIMTPILDAYDKLTDFTAFTNDMKDKAVIYEKACEVRLGEALDSLTDHMDIMGDGANMSVAGITADAANIKRIASDVLYTHN
jgi:hypothetical protein